MALATSSLPVPLSPTTRMVEREGAACGDELEDLLHALALAHDLGEAALVLEGGAELAVLVLEAPLLEGVAAGCAGAPRA